MLLCIDGMTGVYHCAQPLVKKGSQELFAQADLKSPSSISLPPE
jgi:hypothetical protein